MRRKVNFRIPPPGWHHHPAVRTGAQRDLAREIHTHTVPKPAGATDPNVQPNPGS
jgi:hypothetical protein